MDYQDYHDFKEHFAPELFPDGINNHQKKTIRMALNQYHDLWERSWATISGEIQDSTGIIIGSESIRCFAEGEYDRPETGQVAGLKPISSLFAVTYFLLRLNIPIINETDLQTASALNLAPLSLLRHLYIDDDVPVTLHKKMCNAFFSVHTHKGLTYHSITLELSGCGRYIEVYEKLVAALPGVAFNANAIKAKPLVSIESGGWGVVTPENQLLIFTKRTDTGQNQLYVAVAAPDDFSNYGGPPVLCLMHHSEPVGYVYAGNDKIDVDTEKTASSAQKSVLNNIVTFQLLNEENLTSILDKAYSNYDKKPEKRLNEKELFDLFAGSKRFQARQPEHNSVEDQLNDLGKKLIDAIDTLGYSIESVKDLVLQQGAPINYQDPRNGLTPMHYAVSCNDIDVVDFLLEQEDLDLCIRDKRGRLAFQMGSNALLQIRLISLTHKQSKARGFIPAATGDIPWPPDKHNSYDPEP